MRNYLIADTLRFIQSPFIAEGSQGSKSGRSSFECTKYVVCFLRCLIFTTMNIWGQVVWFSSFREKRTASQSVIKRSSGNHRVEEKETRDVSQCREKGIGEKWQKGGEK